MNGLPTYLKVTLLCGVCIIVLSFDIFRGRRDTMYQGSLRAAGESVLQQPGVFVSPTGNDANSGTNRNAPIVTISLGITRAQQYGLTNVYIAKGTFTRGSGLSSSGDGIVIRASGMRIRGGLTPLSYGWIRVTNDMSMLDGGGLDPARVISFSNATNIHFDGFLVAGGSNIDGGGMYFDNAVSNTITNCMISNCGQMAGSGSAIRMESGTRFCRLSVDITRSTTVNGRIVFCFGAASNSISGRFTANRADPNGIMVDLQGAGNVLSAHITSNECYYIVSIQNQASLVSNSYFVDNTTAAANGYPVYIVGVPFGPVLCGVMNSVIYRNYTANPLHVITLGSLGVGRSDIAIVSNFFGVAPGVATAIYETVAATSGHILVGNRFKSDALNFLYHDFTGGDTSAVNIPDLNFASHPSHTAAVAGGNSVTNGLPW